MATNSSAVAEKETGSEGGAQSVLVFELEGAAVNGRAKLYDVLQDAFKDAGLSLTKFQFARYCLHGAVPDIIAKVVAELGQGKIKDGAEEALFNDFSASFGKNVQVHPIFSAVLAEAASRGMAMHAVTILPEDSAKQALEAAGLAKHNVEVHAFPASERHFPRVDCWMKVVRVAAKSPRSCIAVIGCRDSGKSALSSGLRCVVVPDSFTAYQDFGGTDAVLENTEDYPVKDLLNDLA